MHKRGRKRETRKGESTRDLELERSKVVEDKNKWENK